MSFLDDIFGEEEHFPNYRDTFLINGTILFKATGRFFSTMLELQMVDIPSKLILFNVNVDEQIYKRFHKNYDLFRLKDSNDFSNHGITTSDGHYYPTGRLYNNNGTMLWEFMKDDTPADIQYIRMPSLIEGNFIKGRRCI